ncbi:hypothetical protein GCM10023167_06090 [Brevibacterium pityocampae]|uniref:Uncharacterized protein n=1 Tax=Brevibacterium pityocampae TaxID=506594 RepID=A0ABP8J4F7_9MICO
MTVVPSACRAVIWAGRMRAGPEPNRPSAGRSSDGIFTVCSAFITPGSYRGAVRASASAHRADTLGTRVPAQ